MKKKKINQRKIQKENTSPPLYWFYFKLVIIPIAFFIFLEIFLRTINEGTDYVILLLSSKYILIS